MKLLASLLAVSSVVALPALAQNIQSTGFVGAGFSAPVKDIGSRLDTGWNIAAGAGANFGKHAGLLVDFMFNDLPINQATLSSQQVPDGTARVWGITLDPVVHLVSQGAEGKPYDFYLTGGGGIYHRTVEFTQPALATVPVFDPFLGIIYPASIVTTEVIASRSNYKGGLDIGGGVSYRLGSSRAKLFAEARYHYMFTSPTPTTLLPVFFGVRW